MKDYEKKILILRSCCVNFPILAEMAASIKKPFGILLPEASQMGTVIRLISDAAIVVQPSDTQAQVNEKIRIIHSRGVFARVTNSFTRKDSEIFKLLLARSSDADFHSGAIFFLTSQLFPEELKPELVEVTLASNIRESIKIFFPALVPHSDELRLVEDRVRVCKPLIDPQMPESKFFYAAVECMYPGLQRMERPDAFEEIKNYVPKLLDEIRSMRETNLVEMLFEEIIAAVDEGVFPEVLRLPEVNCKAEELTAHAFLSRNCKTLYLPEKVMRSFAERIGCSLAGLLTQLQQEDILLSDCGTYTTKMTCKTSNGQRLRLRMLRLDLEKLGTDFGDDLKNSFIY